MCPLTSFCVVLVANEAREPIERFIDHYLGLGAAQVSVFYDGTADFSLPDREGRVVFTNCDTEFWKKLLGARPVIWNDRQRGLYAHAIEQRQEDWVLLIDCDEYLVSERPVSDVLSDIPSDIDIVRIRNVEAIWGPGDDRHSLLGARWFRHPIRGSRWARAVLRLVYGDLSKYMSNGLLGHANGKHFVRPGKQYHRTTAHNSFYPDGRPGIWIDRLLSDQIAVHHFDAMSFELWSRKFLRRSRNSATHGHRRKERVELIELVHETSEHDTETMRKLFERLYCFSPWQAFVLRKLGLASKRDIFNEQPIITRAEQPSGEFPA